MKIYFPKIYAEPVRVRPGDRFCLLVDEIPSSGYTWTLESSEGVELLADSFKDHDEQLKELGVNPKYLVEENPDPEVCGNRMNRLLVMRALRPGEITLELMPPGRGQSAEERIEMEVETHECY